MAKKRTDKESKRKRAKRLEARAQRLKLVAEPEAPAELPDRRVMERVMRGLAGNVTADSAVDRAQQIMYDAWETRDPKERAGLALEALSISHDCADAFLLLAEEVAGSMDAMVAFHYAAVAAGERALGEKAFEDDVGHFWGILETRPYMRARAGLAQCLWAVGKREEAVDHYEDMLRLNPNDNQGLRYQHQAWLLILDRHAEVKQLLEEYSEESSAIWAYSSALVAYREHGDTSETRSLLTNAVKLNPNIPKYLLRQKKLPRHAPDYVGIGDESEAVTYAIENIIPWQQTKGALEWLKTVEGSVR